MAIITTSQYFPWVWGFEKRGGRSERVSRTVSGIFIGSIVGVGSVVTIVATHPTEDLSVGWAWIDVVGSPLSRAGILYISKD